MSLAERAEKLPTGPGVYLFKSDRGRVLYVGKAQNLRARVRQYVAGGDGRIRIPRLLERAVDVDVVRVGSVPHSNHALVGSPFGLTCPFARNDVDVTLSPASVVAVCA